MMNSSNLPPIWRFDFGDYTGLGAIFQKFLSNLNLFTLSVYNLLNGGIGFANLQRTVYSTTVLAGTTTPLVFVNPLTISPSGISVVQALQEGKTNTALTTAVSAANWYFDGKNINILNITGLTSGNTYQIALEVM
jgi:hypothetical protein